MADEKTGDCLAAGDGSIIPDQDGTELLFGETVQLSCQQKMTRAELTSYCSETSNLDAYYAFKQLTETFNFVSPLGDANPVYIKDWMPVVKPDPTTYAAKPENWVEETSTCSGTITGWAIKFITSSLGQTRNLQKYIVGASIEPITSTMTFSNADATSAQSFTHLLTVSF
jgi:hypothetical protein